MGKTPMQQKWQPGRQASQSPERAVVEASAASRMGKRDDTRGKCRGLILAKVGAPRLFVGDTTFPAANVLR